MRSRFDSDRFDSSLVGLQWALRFVLLAMVILALAACGDDPTADGDPIAVVQVTATEPTVELGDSVLLSAAPKEADGTVRTDLTVSWFSTDTSVARVEGRAGQKGMVVGKKAGTATIRAMAGSKTGETTIEVTVTGPAAPVITTIAPATATEGDPLLTITVTGANFSEMSLVKWNGVAVATEFVSPTVLRALITPSALAHAGTAEVTVRTGPPGGGTSTGKPFIVLSRVAAVNVSVRAAVWVGEEVQADATPQDQGGNDLPKRNTSWSTSDATVLEVNAQGVVRTLREGYAEVRATVDGKTGSEGIYVKAAPNYDLMYDSPRGGGARELWIISLGADATPRRWLAEGFMGEDAATNPTGTKIAFVSRDQFMNTDIWVANRDGSGLTRLTTYEGADDQPTWSTDGSKIVFRSMRSGQSHIWIMDADGSNQRNLMGNMYNVLGGQHSKPTFATNGRVYFQISYPDFGERTTLASISTNGTADVIEYTPQALNDSDPSVSWSGHMMIVRRKQGAIDYGFVYLDLHGQPVFSIHQPGPGYMPAWSRNDQWIAYSASPVGNNPIDIYVSKPHELWFKRITIGDVGRNPVFIKR